MPEPGRAQPAKGEYPTPITTSTPTAGDLRAPDRGHRRMAHYTTPPGIGPGNYVIRLGRARAADSDESASYFELCRCRVYSNLGSGIRESSTTVEHLELIRSTRFRVLSDLVS